MGSEVGSGEMVTSFRGWDEGIEVGGWQPDKRLAWQEEVRRGAPSLPVLHMSLESLSHMQELYYSYEDCLRNAYSMDLELNRSCSAVSMSCGETSDYGNACRPIPSVATQSLASLVTQEGEHELLEEPVEERQEGGERIAWEFHHVTLQRVPGYGFGIAVSGGRDNPHFTNGDPSIAISDVLKAGPAEGKLMINDRVISANSVSLEGVDYATAVQVLRDSGHSVNLVVKRRVVLPSPPEPQTVKVSLYKNKKKEDFGIVLGCKIYIKEICPRSVADKDGNLQDGDIVQKINNVSLDGLSLKEARKLLDAAKDRLDVTVKRDPYKNASSNRMSPQGKVENEDKNNQNLYVPPPSRKDEKNNLVRAEEMLENGAPPRPPLPRDEAEYNLSPRKTGEESSLNTKNKGNLPDPRFISFKKEGSVGIRLTGGNDVGIFVTAVQPGSPAAVQGLTPGDKIIKVNDMDMNGVTREEAVLFLLSLQDQIDLIAQFRKDEYDQIVQLQRGDSFYIRAHFNYEQTEKGEMSFKNSDVFHVVDTLHNGVVGSWQAFRMDPFLSGLGRAAEQVQKGVIPNKSRAEEIATQQFNAAKKEQSVCENNM